MSGKFIRRTLRNVVLRNRPYFAHLALTHRCNLRCRFCQIQSTRFDELDTERMKRVIDALDRLGVGVISVSGGGEPLLRDDFDEILDYAAARGLYTKMTSNGTMPRERYERLLRCGIREIAISLDGVEGNEIPYSHCGPRILETLRYLHDHLPAGKQLTINVTVTESNRQKLEGIVAHCAREFPRAKVWLNPVVVGAGKLRTDSQTLVNPEYLDRTESPNLLRARFYNDAVKQQWCAGGNWGCRAGRMFFDVKPNGDVWACQDVPSPHPINALDPDFEQKLAACGFDQKNACSGCTYSCYMLTQKGLEPRNWPDMAGVWWTANTHPHEACRTVAARRGWIAGLLCFCATRWWPRAARLVEAAALALVMAIAACGQPAPALDPDEVISRMEAANAARQRALISHQGIRTYEAGNSRLKRHAELVARFRFEEPATREFEVIASSGSKAIRRAVIEPLMAAERESGRGKARRDVEICRRNYRFVFGGFDESERSWIFRVEPAMPNRYLFRGTIRVDEASFGIRRIEGEPSKAPSFWVVRTRFVHEYGQFDGFWLPVRHRTEADLRVFGRSSLRIDYSGYRVDSRASASR
jgi:MoaA/NifB/PqqE/SkfB family radical SAM enzyme